MRTHCAGWKAQMNTQSYEGPSLNPRFYHLCLTKSLNNSTGIISLPDRKLLWFRQGNRDHLDPAPDSCSSCGPLSRCSRSIRPALSQRSSRVLLDVLQMKEKLTRVHHRLLLGCPQEGICCEIDLRQIKHCSNKTVYRWPQSEQVFNSICRSVHQI